MLEKDLRHREMTLKSGKTNTHNNSQREFIEENQNNKMTFNFQIQKPIKKEPPGWNIKSSKRKGILNGFRV